MYTIASLFWFDLYQDPLYVVSDLLGVAVSKEKFKRAAKLRDAKDWILRERSVSPRCVCLCFSVCSVPHRAWVCGLVECKAESFECVRVGARLAMQASPCWFVAYMRWWLIPVRSSPQ